MDDVSGENIANVFLKANFEGRPVGLPRLAHVFGQGSKRVACVYTLFSMLACFWSRLQQYRWAYVNRGFSPEKKADTEHASLSFPFAPR